MPSIQLANYELWGKKLSILFEKLRSLSINRKETPPAQATAENSDVVKKGGHKTSLRGLGDMQ